MERPIYANTVTVTASDDRNEFILTFSQKYPAYNVQNGAVSPAESIVASVVLGGKLADLLQQSLQSALSGSNEAVNSDGEHH